MFEHLCFFKCKPETGHEQIEHIKSQFLRLKGIIPGLIEVSFGINITKETQFANGYHMGLRMLFESQQAVEAYLIHPEHVKVSDYVFSCIQEVSVCDFTV
ncbi:Dabb family protein [Paenibacillus thalictri]|uniref:Dabb family protein n=1 Tax=Paenibacillus thalictri TaxID=2527873 RepID=A0A4V2J3Z9_9BACL|nr:Dabb family protein [Paenibacillus thalictri]TBL76535.1 Dabb family protein [Paenibacillus thalictri]